MPPSFLVDKYKIDGIEQRQGIAKSKSFEFSGVLTDGNLMIDINDRLDAKLTDGWKTNEPEFAEYYIKWPTRFSFTCKSGRENDSRLKLLKWPAYHEELNRLFGSEWDSPALEYAHGWVRNVRKNFAYDDWTKKYVAEHEEAHPARNISWGQVLAYGYMPDLFEFTGDFVKWWDDEFISPGDWSLSQSTLNKGIRGRSPIVSFKAYQTFVMDRARQIGFNPGPSTVNAFSKHDAQVKYMRSIFDIYEKLWGCRIISPKTEGGAAYTILRDAYMAGEILTNYDVSGMELITPSILAGNLHKLPPGIGCCVSYLGIIPELLSGVGCTGDWDIFAHLELIGKLIIKTPKIICILGDDGTYVGGELRKSVLYERQDTDERIHRTLGLTTTKYMHPVGKNITIDNSKQSLLVVPDQWIKNKLTFEERDAIADLFLGNVNGVPLHELIGRIGPLPFVYSPKELIGKGLGIKYW